MGFDRIFLMGFMASGKSTLGKKLAKALDYSFVDLDQYIEEKQGKSIVELFEIGGEENFRLIESNALDDIIQNTGNEVVSLGGGTALLPNNLKKIQENGRSIYLKIDPKILIGRLREQRTSRPLIAQKSPEEIVEFVEELLQEREAIYLQADHVLEENNSKLKQLIALLT